MASLLKMGGRIRVRRPLSMKQARCITVDPAFTWGDRIFRRIAYATGDLDLAAATANRVYRKLLAQTKVIHPGHVPAAFSILTARGVEPEVAADMVDEK